MNFYRSEESSSSCCYFHPKEAVVGICALCLKERLVILASKQGHHHHHHHHLPLPKDTHTTTHKSFRILRKKPIITFNKVFALGSFLHRLDFKQSKPDVVDEIDSIPSLEDSFISIKFEENGKAMWDDNKRGMMMMMMKKKENEVNSVVEHSKPRGTLRWRKRIGHLLQLARWKRSTKGAPCHVGLPGKVEGRRGWIRSLTRRRTTINT